MYFCATQQITIVTVSEHTKLQRSKGLKNQKAIPYKKESSTQGIKL